MNFLPRPSVPRHPVPLFSEPAARTLVERLGGPRGRHEGRLRGFWQPGVALLATGLIVYGLGFLAKVPCIRSHYLEDGRQALDWSGHKQYTTACYNDIVPLFSGRGLDQPGFSYAYSWVENGVTRYMEYPVITGVFQWLMGALTRLVSPATSWLLPVTVYFTLTAFVLALVWIVVVRLTVSLTGPRTWDTLLVAASPLVIVHALTNWDILSIVFALGGMVAMRRNQSVLGGVLFGLGAATKLWPLLLIGAYMVLALRTRVYAPAAKALVSAAFTWVLVNLPIALQYPQAWGEFFRLNRERTYEWTTIWALADAAARSLTGGSVITPSIANAGSFFLFALACGAIALLGWKARRPPRIAELAFLIVAAFLLVNKVWSPQYSLWLVPLVALAVPRWRLVYAWQVAEAAVWPVLMWYFLGEDNKGVPLGLVHTVVLIRDAFLIALIVMVVRHIQGRSEDKVRLAASEDPLAPGWAGTGFQTDAGVVPDSASRQGAGAASVMVPPMNSTKEST